MTTSAANTIVPLGQLRSLTRSARDGATRSLSSGSGVSSLVAGFVEESDAGEVSVVDGATLRVQGNSRVYLVQDASSLRPTRPRSW